MKELTYESQGTSTYLVYTVSEDDCVDSMSLGMLTNNRIAGLASVNFTQMDTTKYIKYDVASHISVKQFFSGPVNKKRLTGVFNGIVDAMLSAEDYMLDANSIILDLDYIFADVSTCETVLICLPIENPEAETVDLGAFFKNIMFSTQFDQTEDCDYVAKIMNYLNGAPIFSLTDFKEVLNGLDTSARTQTRVEPIQPTAVPEKEVVSERRFTPPAPVEKMEKEQPRVEVTPPRPTPPPTVEPPVASVEKDEKKMTLFGLLSHYNKENAALYKAQKAEGKKQPKEKKVKEDKKSKKKDTKKEKTPPSMGFVIPGMEQPPISPKPSEPATPTEMPKSFDRPNPAPYIPPVPQGHSANYGETTVLGDMGDGKTTVLIQNPAQMTSAYLIRKKTGEKILLNKPVFRMGKERSYVDYFIGDNTAISRSHANIITRDGKYFVVDTNSTNHTFVDGEMLQCNVETEISHGSVVRLANEDFEFKTY